MKRPVFTGCATALVTPFTDRGVDYDRLAAAIERQAEGGTAAVVVCGTTGEAATLSEAERASIIEFVSVSARSRMKVIAGIGGNDTLAAAAAARRAERLGADALLLTTPYYNKASSDGIFRHFTYVAEHSELPLIVYNVPARTGVACTAEHYARLAENPRINGVKEASGDISLVSRTRHLCGDALNIWSGNDDQTLPMLALGARGVISVASNIVPQVMATLCSAALSGDFFTARALHEAYAGLFTALFSDVNPIPVKAAMQLLGWDSGRLRLPLCPTTKENAAKLKECMESLQLL